VPNVRTTKEMERICIRLWPNLKWYSNIYLERFRERTNNSGYRVIRLGFDRGTSRIHAIVITAWASLIGGTMYCSTLGTGSMICHRNVVPNQKGFMIEFWSWMTERETIATHTVLLQTDPNFDVKYVDSSSQKTQNETQLERRCRPRRENKSSESGWSI